ncbi:TRAP transporter small permease [Castellaniella sp. WN]
MSAGTSHAPQSAGGPPAGPGSLQRRILSMTGILDRISAVMIMATMATMAAMVSLQVFWRYVLGSSIDSADELSRLFFIWAMFLAIPQGVKYSVHVGIDLFLYAFSPAMRERLFRLVSAAGVVLMAATFYAAWIATADKWQELMPTLPITAAIYYLSVLWCVGHSTLHLLIHTCFGSKAWGDLML